MRKGRQQRTVGLEWELQILDSETLDLSNGILPIMEMVPDCPYLKPEFIQNTVEIASKPCRGLEELEEHVAETLQRLVEASRRLGLLLCGAGTHPFSQQLSLLTPLPRYLDMEQSMGILSHLQVTFGMHVHVGMRSKAEIIEVANHLREHLPLLIALSANSPYWRGYETGHASYRQRILAAARSYGIPPLLSSWNEFGDFLEKTRRAGVFDSIRDIHWDIRPRGDLGTIEVRAMDAQSTVRETLDLAGFVVTLVENLSSRSAGDARRYRKSSPKWWLETENHFQAARLGIDAPLLIDDSALSSAVLRERALALIDQMEETARSIGTVGHLGRLRQRIAADRLGYQSQREARGSAGTLESVVEFLSGRLSGPWTTSLPIEAQTPEGARLVLEGGIS